MDEELPQLPSFHKKNYRSLRSINIEKHFKVSYNKEYHKVKALVIG
jgi:hypothetical protein